MKNNTFDDVRYFLLGLQVANTADIFVDKSKTQSSETQTYSRSTVYIDADGDLCSNDTKVSTVDHTHDEYVNIVYSDTEPTTQRVGDCWCQDYE